MIDFVIIKDASSDLSDFVTRYTKYCSDMIFYLQVLESVVHSSYLKQTIHQYILDYSNLSKEVSTSCQSVSHDLDQYILDSKQNLQNLTNDFSNILKEFESNFTMIDSL